VTIRNLCIFFTSTSRRHAAGRSVCRAESLRKRLLIRWRVTTLGHLTASGQYGDSIWQRLRFPAAREMQR